MSAIHVELPDGSKIEINEGATALNLAEGVGPRLAPGRQADDCLRGDGEGRGRGRHPGGHWLVGRGQLGQSPRVAACR